MSKQDLITPKMRDIHDHIDKRMNELDLKLINGGGGDGTNLNWLNGMAEQTVFIAREKNRGATMPRYLLAQFILARKFPKSFMVGRDNGNMQNIYLFVDPYHFSNSWELVEVLYDPETMPAIEYEKEHPTEEVGKEKETADDGSLGVGPRPEGKTSDLVSPSGTETGNKGSEG